MLTALVVTACGGQTAKPQKNADPVNAVIDVSSLPNGPVPKIAWRADGVLHLGRRAVKLPGSYPVVVTTKRIVTVEADADGERSVVVRDLSGTIEASFSADVGTFALNHERNIVAWATPDGTPTILQDDLPRPLPLPGKTTDFADVIAVNGHDCSAGPEEVEGAGCSVYFIAQENDATHSFVSSNHGLVEPLGGPITGLHDVSSRGMQTGVTTVRPNKICGANITNSGSSQHFCDHYPAAFSPSGTKILGYPPKLTERQSSEFRVYSAQENALLGKWRIKAKVWSVDWEDDDHLLAVASPRKGMLAIVRVGLDGTTEVAEKPWSSGDVEQGTSWFAVQP